MKVCTPIELKKPEVKKMKLLVKVLMPKFKKNMIMQITEYVDGDLRKLNNLHNIYKVNPLLINDKLITDVFYPKNFNKNTKDTTKLSLNNKYNIEEHSLLINDTDRTSISLLFHENLIDVLKYKKQLSIPFYSKVLSNICFADYIDRITFQKQIWIFNEMSSLIKTFYNNYLYHTTFDKKFLFNPVEVRFTKVLTKYSTEYNNSVFLQQLSFKLQIDKTCLKIYFDYLRKHYELEEIENIFQKK